MKRIIFLVSGLIFLILGLIGLALPVIPQVPFLGIGILLLARGSARVHNWLMSNSFFKTRIRPHLENSRFFSKLLDE